jgi:putative DNA primase/helicase
MGHPDMASQPLPDIMDQCRGRWPGLLPKVGIAPKALNGKHGPCPMCEGRDRFRFLNTGGNGTYVCNQCGGGNGMQLVMAFKGLDFKGAAALLRQYVGDTPMVAPAKVVAANRRALARDLWAEGVPIAGTLAADYLAARGLAGADSPALRFHPDCRLTEVPGHTSAPAVLLRVDDAKGELCGVTRTYLDGPAKAAWIDERGEPMMQRKFLGDFPNGCAARLSEAGHKLAVAEGYETALAVQRLYRMPCWALLNTSLMETWTPPPGVRQLLVCGDSDRKYGGQKAAYTLAHRVACFKEPPEVAVRLPKLLGNDMLDVLVSKAP